jgi:hypothetical protein
VNSLPKLASTHDPPDLTLSSTRITGMSHWHLACSFLQIYRTCISKFYSENKLLILLDACKDS